MVIRASNLLLATALALPVAGNAATPTGADLYLSADITVDAAGRIQSLQWAQLGTPHHAVAQRIEPAVRQWEFEPGTINGVPTETRTSLNVHVVASDAPGGAIQLRFAKATTGPVATQMVVPRYPRAGFRAGVSAKVVATVEVGADGSVSMVDSRFEGSKGSRGKAAFVAATEDSLRASTFRPETVGGHGVATRIEVPFAYCLSDSTWCERQAEATDARLAVPSGTPVALDSAVSLKTDIRAQQI